jgi:hypothetical protein
VELNNPCIFPNTTGVIKSPTEKWMWIGHLSLLVKGNSPCGLNNHDPKVRGASGK